VPPGSAAQCGHDFFPAIAEDGVSYTVYFRDSEECLHSLRHRAASESEALDWFTRMGITVVAIRAEFAGPAVRTA
jgi:hypothetical protein